MPSSVVINEDGSAVDVKLFYMRHHHGHLEDCDTIEEAIEFGDAVRDNGSGAPVCVLVDNQVVRWCEGEWRQPREDDMEELRELGVVGVRFR